MKLGILAYASPTGLGYQTRDYVKHLNPAKILAVDLSMYNLMPVYREWYKDYETIWTNGIPNNDEINRFLNGLDVVFMAETPLNYYLFEEATRRGIKTFNAFNYEFLDYYRHPEWASPTVLAAPTVWNIEKVHALNKGKVHVFPVPIERNSELIFKKKLKTIMHVIGRPAVMDRNGTMTFLSAIERLGNKYSYEIYYQEPRDRRAIEYFEPVKRRLLEVRNRVNIKVVVDIQNNLDMYRTADLMILPRRYGGLCLPMQEALNFGIPVMMTNVSPNNDRLPENWLIDCHQIDTFRGHVDIPVYEGKVNSILDKLERFSDDSYMESESKIANALADELSWDILREKYLQWFAEL